MPKTYSREDAASHIQEFLDPVLHYAGLKLNYTISEGETVHPDFENPDFLVRFEGEDVDLLLANKAELLLALEQLTTEALGMTPEQHSRLCFDANDHRVLRIEELRMSAQAAADRVKRTRIPFHFSPMSSRERRIIHLALRNETAVRSESVGQGSFRQVVVVPADMKTLPEPIRPPRPPRSSDGFRGREGGEEVRRERPRGPRRDRGRRR